MSKMRGSTIAIGTLFGFVTFAVSVFFVSPQLSVLLGLFTACSYIIVFIVILDLNFNKYIDIEKRIDQEILLKETANCYDNNQLYNGVLFLTNSDLIFISREKKEEVYIQIQISSIKIVTYGKIFKHIVGLKIVKQNGYIFGFVVRKVEDYIEKINERLEVKPT